MTKFNNTLLASKYSRLRLLVVYLCFGLASSLAQMTFVHPGAMNSKADLDYVKAKIAAGEQPWTTKFNQVKAIATTYTRTTSPQDGAENDQKADGRLAYANALAWYYTGNEAYAKNAIAVLNVWGKTFNGYALPPVGQGNQALLNAGWVGALLGPAAEIMRGYSGWAVADMDVVKNMFKTKFYPALNQMSPWNGNVDLTQIDAMMNIAVFCEDETEFKLGIQRLKSRNPAYFYLTTDPASALNYGGSSQGSWSSPTSWVNGLTQETCRDNNHHAQYALASALHAAEVAWNQGVDVYTENTERYTAALELMAIQILSGKMGTCANNTTTTSLFNTWEVGYNHYHNRKGISLPNTLSLLTTRVRANSQSDWNIFYETLTHNLDGNMTTSLEESEVMDSEFTCYPNPFSDRINFTANGVYCLYTLSGMEIEKGSCAGDCSVAANLERGVYVLEVQHGGRKDHIKVVKQ